MERRVTSHTEEEEMNQRRRLLTLARKGDQKSIELLFELYQVKVFSGDALKKKKLPSFPILKPTNVSGKGSSRALKSKAKAALAIPKPPKENRETAKSTEKGLSKIKASINTTQTSSKKITKSNFQQKLEGKKATLPKKKSLEKPTKLQNPSAAKKPRIAKKK